MKTDLASVFKTPALRFVLIMGLVNLFSDLTYEGGGSINGQFLGTLGASGAAISIIAGVGEFVGYCIRGLSGYFADKTKKHWLITFIGYFINLFAVPAMALAGNWPVAAALIISERVGRAIRKPTVESMLSYTTGKYGKGWVYGLNTALDETGATIGPLLMSLVLIFHGNYKLGYAALLVSSILAIAALVSARVSFPVPSDLEAGDKPAATNKNFSRSYWLYMLAASFFAAGLMSYELVSFHLARTHQISEEWIPAFLAFSTGCGIVASLVLGKCYDKFRSPVVLVAVALSSAFAPLVFSGNFTLMVLSMPLWGIGYATQDTLFKAIIAGVMPEGRRSFAFGLFYTGYGFGWLLGSVVSGLLYERSLPLLAGCAAGFQLVSLPIFFAASRMQDSD